MDAKRGVIKGWSRDAVRRHTKWLYSIDAPALDGVGVAVTITVPATPDTPDEWLAARRAWMKRLERLGAVRIHFVTEWTRRKVPHVHAAVYFPEGTPENFAITAPPLAWLAVASDSLGSLWQGQESKLISGAEGWLQYLSKHAARGVAHYQRQGTPEAWKGGTGRLWGHWGQWPAEVPMRFDIANEAGYRLRRLIRARRIADARASGDSKRIASARRMLKCNDRKLSTVRGFSEWVSQDELLVLLGLLASEGWVVLQRDDS